MAESSRRSKVVHDDLDKTPIAQSGESSLSTTTATTQEPTAKIEGLSDNLDSSPSVEEEPVGQFKAKASLEDQESADTETPGCDPSGALVSASLVATSPNKSPATSTTSRCENHGENKNRVVLTPLHLLSVLDQGEQPPDSGCLDGECAADTVASDKSAPSARVVAIPVTHPQPGKDGVFSGPSPDLLPSEDYLPIIDTRCKVEVISERRNMNHPLQFIFMIKGGAPTPHE